MSNDFLKMKNFFIGLLILISISCNDSKNEVPEDSSLPNVVLIVVDDLGWKDLGFMGSSFYETPALDAFSKQGMVFTQAYASASNCAPSRACLLSGMQTPRHGVYTVSSSERGNAKTRKIIPTKNTLHLSNDDFLLPDLFRSMGYKTGSFGKWHVGEDPSLQGIDVNVGGSNKGNPGKDGYFSPYNIDFITDGPDGEYLTDRLTTEAIQFMTTHQKSPFFLYIPYYTVHTPIMGKPALIEKFENKKGSNGQKNATYAAMVAAMDENVNKLLGALKQLELEENTIVIFTSDNGGIRAISDQSPLRAGKGSYYEGGIRVPMVVRWPKQIKAGSTCDTRVTNLDFYPTLKQIINAKQSPEFLDGTDISPLFDGEEIEDRDLVWHFPIYLNAYNMKLDDGRDPLFRTRPGTVLIDGDWKLHEYFEDNGLELYDLNADPGERNNLAEAYPDKVKSLHQKMRDWRAKMNAPLPKTPNPLYDSDFEKQKILSFYN